MHRNIIADLLKWKDSPHRKPLILQGARQTGKTWIMKEFGITPYYWSAKDGTAEVDFIFQNDDEIVPVEVKAEVNLQAKSLKLYREAYDPAVAFRFSLSDYADHGGLKNVPLYALPAIRQFLRG